MVSRLTEGNDNTYRYVRSNYRKSGGHFDYGRVQAFLNKTITISTDASGLYYTQVGALWSEELNGTGIAGQLISAHVIANLVLGTYRTSVWGSADTDDSILAVVNGWLTYSSSAPSGYICWLVLHASATLSLLYSANALNFAINTTLFVVSR